MKNYQLDELFGLYHDNGYSYRHYLDVSMKHPITRLMAMSGPMKGKIGDLMVMNSGKLTVRFEGGVNKQFHYGKLEHVNDKGEAQIRPTTDMTDRTLQVGDMVCHSQSAGRTSHALGIGKIIKISEIGGLVVEPRLKNGEKPQASGWYYRNRQNVDANRCLKLPVDDNIMMLWMLSDFETLNDEYKDDDAA